MPDAFAQCGTKGRTLFSATGYRFFQLTVQIAARTGSAGKPKIFSLRRESSRFTERYACACGQCDNASGVYTSGTRLLAQVLYDNPNVLAPREFRMRRGIGQEKSSVIPKGETKLADIETGLGIESKSGIEIWNRGSGWETTG
ncbi:hypothetical protein EVAR_6963_1 [Eumeta japonica]|uniref:Uncharacterized protein n=1 Tax=Eumeta variegata TaxID=151549 RepID=A0A4C1THM2_EUMVA|nr:hypothetical protein EVAR_6963_1 [Eumeta japonica]